MLFFLRGTLKPNAEAKEAISYHRLEIEERDD
jgi:hypothetical protein